MKKYILLVICLTLISCGYSKEDEVFKSRKGQVYYVVWVYKNGINLMNGFSLPIQDMTEIKKDSLNSEADYFIQKCEAYD